ncbi:MAG: mechanosensitive ion channel family protein, partial [Thermoanaerobaculia bacterium]
LVSLPVLLGIAWLLSHWLVKLFRPLLLRGSEEQRARTLTQFKWLLFVLIFSVTVRILSSKAVTVAGRIVFASIANVLMIVAASLLLVWLTRLATRSKILRLQQAGMPSTIATVELSGWLVVCACVIAGLFLTLRTLGLEATAAVAGLGVGGIAIAFAAQKTIENLFGTVTIVTDKPIHVGDYCQAGSTEGGVESIGLRSTRIRTLDRALVTIPNGQLAGMAIGNLTHRDKFLFRHNIRLRYETTADQLRQVLTNIRKMMWAHSKLEAGTIRIRLIRFADYSLDLEVFAYVLTHDTPAFLEIQEELLLAIMDIIEESGTSVALPFQTTPATENIDPDAPPGKVTQHRQPRAQRVS